MFKQLFLLRIKCADFVSLLITLTNQNIAQKFVSKFYEK